MKIVLDRELPASSDRVWRALTDPAQLKACIPGCRALIRIDDARWGGAVVLKIHTLTLEFSSRMGIIMAYPPEGFVLRFHLTHPVTGNITGTAWARLIAGPLDETPLTFLHYDVHMQASGLLANVDERLIKEIAYRWTDMFFIRLSDTLKAEETSAAASLNLFSHFFPFPRLRGERKTTLRDRKKSASSPMLAA